MADCSHAGTKIFPGWEWIVPSKGTFRELTASMGRAVFSDSWSSILADFEITARQLLLSAEEIPINGNNCYI